MARRESIMDLCICRVFSSFSERWLVHNLPIYLLDDHRQLARLRWRFEYVGVVCRGIFQVLQLVFPPQTIKKSLQSLEKLLVFSADVRFKNRDHVRAPAKTIYKVYKMYGLSAMLTVTSGAFVPIFSHKHHTKIWFPFNTETGFNFWFSSYYLVAISYYVSAICIALDVLQVIFICFAIGLISALSVRMKMIGKIEEAAKVEELIKCIKIHKKIVQYIKEINANFSSAIFIQGLLSSIILCASAFTISTVSSLQKQKVFFANKWTFHEIRWMIRHDFSAL